MTETLEHRLGEHFADIATRAAPEPIADIGFLNTPRSELRIDQPSGVRRSGRTLTVAAATVLTLAGGLSYLVSDRSASQHTPVSRPAVTQTTQVPDPATALAADEWPTVPPGATDLEWQYAVDGDSGYASPGARSDRIVYGTATDPKLLIIHIYNPPLDPGIESGLWAAYPPLDGWTETRRLGDTEITVQGAASVDPAIADMLIATPDRMLTLEPLGVRERATPVATAKHNGQDWTVLVERSGRYQMTYVEMRPPGNSEPGSSEPGLRMMMGPERIPRGAELTVDYQPSAFSEGMSPGEVLAIGRAPSDVSSVNVEFSEGTIVTAATTSALPDTPDRYWVAVTSLAGDSQDVSVANVTAADIEGGTQPTQVARMRLAIDEIALDTQVGVPGDDINVRPLLQDGSVPNGSPGITVIFGNRTTYGAPFFDLDLLNEGDTIVVVVGDDSFTYVVTGQFIGVDPAEVLAQSGLNSDISSVLLIGTQHPKYTDREELWIAAVLTSATDAQL